MTFERGIPRFKKEQIEWLKTQGFKFPENDYKFYFEKMNIDILKNC